MCSSVNSNGLDWQTIYNQIHSIYGNTVPPGFQLKLQLLGSAPASTIVPVPNTPPQPVLNNGPVSNIPPVSVNPNPVFNPPSVPNCQAPIAANSPSAAQNGAVIQHTANQYAISNGQQQFNANPNPASTSNGVKPAVRLQLPSPYRLDVPNGVVFKQQATYPTYVAAQNMQLLPNATTLLNKAFVKNKIETNGYSPRLKVAVPKVLGEEASESVAFAPSQNTEAETDLTKIRSEIVEENGKKVVEKCGENEDFEKSGVPELKSTGYRTEDGYKVFINGQTFLFHPGSAKKRSSPVKRNRPNRPTRPFLPQTALPQVFNSHLYPQTQTDRLLTTTQPIQYTTVPNAMQTTVAETNFRPGPEPVQKKRKRSSPIKTMSCARIRHFNKQAFEDSRKRNEKEEIPTVQPYLESLQNLEDILKKKEEEFPWETLKEDSPKPEPSADKGVSEREENLVNAIKSTKSKVGRKRKQNLKKTEDDDTDLTFDSTKFEESFSIYSADGATCARIRPLPSSFVCARCRPYGGLRKEINWCYFMMHPERKFQYRPKKRRLPARTLFSGDCPTVESSRLTANFVASSQMPINIQYRAYICNKGPKLFLSKSLIHGIGVFTEGDVEYGRLVLEYKGEVIRNTLLDLREDNYRRRGFGSYMFRVDNEYTVDATLQGSVARFINHSCDPNCQAKIINYEGAKKIVLFASRYIEQGEELSYNYKMPIEKEKVPCFCGANNCRKTLN